MEKNPRQTRPREAVYPDDYWAECKAVADAKPIGWQKDRHGARQAWGSSKTPNCCAVCLECGKRTHLNRRLIDRVRMPRCAECGGPLELSSQSKADMAQGRTASDPRQGYRVLSDSQLEQGGE